MALFPEAVTVIVAFPSESAVILPDASTDAIEGALLSQTASPSIVAFSGTGEIDSLAVSPVFMTRTEGVTSIDSRIIGAAFTVRRHGTT